MLENFLIKFHNLDDINQWRMEAVPGNIFMQLQPHLAPTHLTRQAVRHAQFCHTISSLTLGSDSVGRVGTDGEAGFRIHNTSPAPVHTSMAGTQGVKSESHCCGWR